MSLSPFKSRLKSLVYFFLDFANIGLTSTEVIMYLFLFCTVIIMTILFHYIVILHYLLRRAPRKLAMLKGNPPKIVTSKVKAVPYTFVRRRVPVREDTYPEPSACEAWWPVPFLAAIISPVFPMGTHLLLGEQ